MRKIAAVALKLPKNPFDVTLVDFFLIAGVGLRGFFVQRRENAVKE